MLIEEKGVRFLTDPGAFTADTHASLTNIDAILFTHEHADHYHVQSLQMLVKLNPSAKIICNASLGPILEKAGITHEVLSDGEATDIKGVAVAGHGVAHAIIHSSLPQMQNTGFLIAGRFWYPGDDLSIDPGVKPELMALPVAGPWMKLSEAIDYALKIKPTAAFPVHDMILNTALTGFVPQTVGNILETHGVRFYPIELDKEYDF